MTPLDWAVVLAGAGLIGTIGWFFFGERDSRRSADRTATRSGRSDG